MLNLFIRNDSLFSLTRHAEGVKRPKHLMTSPLSNKILRFTQNDTFILSSRTDFCIFFPIFPEKNAKKHKKSRKKLKKFTCH